MRSKLYSYGSLFGIDWWRQSYGIGGYWLPRKLQFFCLAKIVVKCMSWTAKVSQWPINWFILKALIPINWLILKALLLIVVPIFKSYSVWHFREFFFLGSTGISKLVTSTVGKSTNILWHDCPIGQTERQKLMNQKGCVVWITGLSGSGLYEMIECPWSHTEFAPPVKLN